MEILVKYDDGFKAVLKEKTPENSAKLLKLGGISDDRVHWKLPYDKKCLKKIPKIFDAKITKDAKMEFKNMSNMAKLDYDGEKFEVYIPVNRKNKNLLSPIGYCYARPTKGCYSIPNNYWSLKKLYELLGKQHISPTKKAKIRLKEMADKKKRIDELAEVLKEIKFLPISEFNIDHEFKGEFELYDYQKKMFWAAKEYLKNKTGFGLFADPGLGKSAPAVNVIEYMIENGYVENCLVITPDIIKYNFGEQMDIHCDLNYNILYSYDYAPSGTASDEAYVYENLEQLFVHYPKFSKDEKGRIWKWTDGNVDLNDYYMDKAEFINEPNTPVQIINYGCLKNELEHFRGNYDMWVVDEGHYLKNRTSDRSKAMKKFSEDIDYRLELTATPISKDFLDLFSQLDILEPDLIPNSFYYFRDKIANTFPMEVSRNTTIEKVASFKNDVIDEWLAPLVSSISIRYTKEEKLDLTEPERHRIVVEPPKELADMYHEMKENRAIEIGSMGDDDYRYLEADNGLVTVTYARQLASGFIGFTGEGNTEYEVISDFKVKALMDLLETFPPGDQVIIWFKHQQLLRMIEEKLDNYAVIDGSKDSMAKSKINQDFKRGKYKYLVASIDVTEGWQGQSANIAVFLENAFTFDVRDQAEGRIHRKGQTKPTAFYDILTKNTIDLKILETVRRRKSLSKRVLADNPEEW